MKKLIPVLLLLLSACRHTDAENYTMINKVVNELTIIKDSITLMDTTVLAKRPVSTTLIEEDESEGKKIKKAWVDSLIKSPDSTYGKMLAKYNRLQQRYFTYQDIYSRVYRELPKDSVEKNREIQQRFERALW